jgi:uncharacterized protein YcbX
MSSRGRRLGVVGGLYRYPVKSMLGEACASIELDARGFRGDRAFAVRDSDGKLGSGKTTGRFRQIDGLIDFRASYEGEWPRIAGPDGKWLVGVGSDVDAALSAWLGRSVTLERESDVPHLDDAPIHLLSTASLRSLERRLPGSRIDARRFRPNLVLDDLDEGESEELWAGRTIRVGPAAVLKITRLTQRCRMTAMPQAELPSDPLIFTIIGRERNLRFGVYADVQVAAKVSRGDAVSLLD